MLPIDLAFPEPYRQKRHITLGLKVFSVIIFKGPHCLCSQECAYLELPHDLRRACDDTVLKSYNIQNSQRDSDYSKFTKFTEFTFHQSPNLTL